MSADICCSNSCFIKCVMVRSLNPNALLCARGGSPSLQYFSALEMKTKNREKAHSLDF